MRFFFFTSYSQDTSITIIRKHLDHQHNIRVDSANQEKNQKNIKECLLQNKPLSEMNGRNENRTKDQRFFISREAILWICADLLPFSLIESDAFSRFWSRTASNTILNVLFIFTFFSSSY